MIYTLTLNPAIDYTISLDCLKTGEVNRTSNEQIYFGGKGINISVVLSRLGLESVALGFIAGFTGKELKKGLEAQSIKTDFIELPDSMTRINVKIKADQETDINALGPVITENAIEQLLKKTQLINDGDILCLSGSVPVGAGDDIYCRILESVSKRNVITVVDTTGKALLNTLEYRPFLIKPNIDELSELNGSAFNNDGEMLEFAKSLQTNGARNVMVSLGGDGAVLICENGETLRSSAPKGKLVDSVGAGDSAVAGFIEGYFNENGSYKNALLTAVCAGSATAFSDGLCTAEAMKKLLSEI